MTSSTGIDDSVALDAGEKRSIWCHSGIDLFVLLQIDSTQSTRLDSLSSRTSSDAPRSKYVPHASFVPPQGVVEESLFTTPILHKGSEPGSRSDGEPSYAKVFPEYLNEDMMSTREVFLQDSGHSTHNETTERIGEEVKQSHKIEERRFVPHVGGRRFVASGASPAAAQRYDCQRLFQWRHHLDERSREYDYMKQCDPEGVPMQFKDGFPADGNLVRGRDCLAVRVNPDERKCASHKDIEDQQRSPSRTDERAFSCSENRRWSPQVDDYHCVPMDMDRDPENQVAGFNGGGIDLGRESWQVCDTSPSSSLIPSENEAVGRMQLELHEGSSPEAIMSNSKFRDIEIFDEAAISAACLLVKMSADDCRKELRDLSPRDKARVYNLGFRGASNEGTLSNIAKETHATPPDLNGRDTRNALQSGAKKVKRSQWGHDDKYIPRLARRAKARLWGSKFSNRINFGNSEVDEDSDCVRFKTPRNLLVYKSTEGLCHA